MIKGKHIAITGILAFYKRSEAFDLIRDHGGIPQENVTKETDYLVVGYYRKICFGKCRFPLQVTWALAGILIAIRTGLPRLCS